MRRRRRESRDALISHHVMAGLDPAIHDFPLLPRRGCPAHLAKLASRWLGMTTEKKTQEMQS
jgi:hypothetical protein